MKIRPGFVSNSSSSSFVMVIVKRAYDLAIANEDPLTKAILEAVMHEDIVLGRKCMTYGDCSSDCWWDEVDADKIIERAKEIADGRLVTACPDAPTDPDDLDEFLKDVVSDSLGQYSVMATFKNVSPDQIWSYDMDW